MFNISKWTLVYLCSFLECGKTIKPSSNLKATTYFDKWCLVFLIEPLVHLCRLQSPVPTMRWKQQRLHALLHLLHLPRHVLSLFYRKYGFTHQNVLLIGFFIHYNVLLSWYTYSRESVAHGLVINPSSDSPIPEEGCPGGFFFSLSV